MRALRNGRVVFCNEPAQSFAITILQHPESSLIRERGTFMNRRRGQSMVEYALGLGCIAGLCMVALSSLGYICHKILHAQEHAINYGGPIGGHAQPMVNVNATPWIIN